MASNATERGPGLSSGSSLPILAEEIMQDALDSKGDVSAYKPKTLPPKSLFIKSDSGEKPFESKTIVSPARVLDEPGTSLFDTGSDSYPEPETGFTEVRSSVAPTASYPTQNSDRLSDYLAKKLRLVFGVGGGMVMMTVIDAIVSDTSILIIVPTETDGCIFIPGVGESIKVNIGSSEYRCSAPGLVTTVPDLGITIITLIREEVLGASDAKPV